MTSKIFNDNKRTGINASVPMWCRAAAVLMPAVLAVFALWCAFEIGRAVGV